MGTYERGWHYILFWLSQSLHQRFLQQSLHGEHRAILDDFDQPNGHTRSDFRRPREVYKVKNMEDLPKVIEAVKKRMTELDQERKKKGGN